MSDWHAVTDGTGTVHVHPLGDLVTHDVDTDQPSCVCGPTVEVVTSPDGPDGWLISHHALDGREHHEPRTDLEGQHQ